MPCGKSHSLAFVAWRTNFSWCGPGSSNRGGQRPVGMGVPRGNGVPPGRKNPKKPAVSWHTTFAESLVCYTFCPGWRGKGAVLWPHRHFSVPAGQVDFAQVYDAKSACPGVGDGEKSEVERRIFPRHRRDKRYIKPPSRRSDISVAVCAADRPARFAPFSSPASSSAGSAPLFRG